MSGRAGRGGTDRSPGAVTEVVVGLVAATVIFVAVPGVLSVAVGLPLAGHRAHPSSPAWQGAFDALAVVAWTAWLGCCAPLARSVIHRVRRCDVSSVPGSPWADRLAATIAAAVLVVLPMTTSVAAGASASPAALARPAPVTATPSMSPSVTRQQPGGPESEGRVDAVSARGIADVEAGAGTYVVQPDDSLWSIAQRLFGDAGEWQSIARLNLGQLMDDGTRFVDPSLIRPGWRLELPSGASTPVVPIQSALPPVEPVHLSVSSFDPPAASPTANVVLARTKAATSAERYAGAGHAPPSLPELSAIGIGALAAAALARRARRARRSADARQDGETGPFGDCDVAVDLATMLDRFYATPALDWLEMANRLLARTESSPRPVPEVLLFRVGPDGVEVWLSGASSWSPPFWERRSDGRVWHLSSTHDPDSLAAACRGLHPAHPALVPIGDDEHGTWLATVDPGCCLPVIGSGADAMVSTMRLAASSWPWSDRLTVSVDPDLVAHETQLVGSADDEASCDHGGVLFVGDPSMVPLRAKERCGILTTLPVPATGLTVAVDARAATIHPLGLTVRPHVLGPRHRTAALELVLPSTTTRPPDPTAQPEPGPLEDNDVETSPLPDKSAVPPMTGGVADPDPSAPGEPPCSAGRSASIPTRSRWPVAARPDPTRITSADLRPLDGRTAPADPWSPGVVEVRLLVATPRLEGTAAALPPKRVRRATELVAYLALHRPSPVTSDRLRTRVLGSPDADAAAKTLFNVATAARSAMGSGPAGEPLLPPALKTGHYRISELVTVDTDRAARLIAAARSADDPDESLAMYRAALGLVEDEPLSGILSGYGWWEAEGHAGRIRALVVDAACEVARLASEAGFDDLAGWAIDRARLLDPYSEALSRAAMRWAASSGDTDRLRREWVECQRRVDELDPGSLPSQRTERLYAELTRRPS